MCCTNLVMTLTLTNIHRGGRSVRQPKLSGQARSSTYLTDDGLVYETERKTCQTELENKWG